MRHETAKQVRNPHVPTGRSEAEVVIRVVSRTRRQMVSSAGDDGNGVPIRIAGKVRPYVSRTLGVPSTPPLSQSVALPAILAASWHSPWTFAPGRSRLSDHVGGMPDSTGSAPALPRTMRATVQQPPETIDKTHQRKKRHGCTSAYLLLCSPSRRWTRFASPSVSVEIE